VRLSLREGFVEARLIFMEERSGSLYERVGAHSGLMRLLHSFYADVRQHSVIGPIFLEKIEDWNAHIKKIAEFWARAMGGPSIYAGQMPLKHLALGLQPEHFKFWLELWDFNCRRHLEPAEAEEMSRLAHGIGERLQRIIEDQRTGSNLFERSGGVAKFR
jgi:hemoglobin